MAVTNKRFICPRCHTVAYTCGLCEECKLSIVDPIDEVEWAVKIEDEPSGLLNLLSCVLPPIGYMLHSDFIEDQPNKAESVRFWASLSFPLWVLVPLVILIRVEYITVYILIALLYLLYIQYVLRHRGKKVESPDKVFYNRIKSFKKSCGVYRYSDLANNLYEYSGKRIKVFLTPVSLLDKYSSRWVMTGLDNGMNTDNEYIIEYKLDPEPQIGEQLLVYGKVVKGTVLKSTSGSKVVPLIKVVASE